MKLKTCKWCKQKFEPSRPTKICCSPDCEYDYGLKHAARAEHIRGIADRKVIKIKLEAIKPLSKWLKEAQAAFNRWIRKRDEALPCVSCGRFHSGAYDAGHYRSVGAAGPLRFDPANVHRQCVPCNQHKSGNVIEYRLGLIQRIGLAEVERIEGPLPDVKWTKEQAIAIKAKYTAMTKELSK